MSEIPFFKYLITGCGHSGTGYCAKLLTSVGLPCGHEALLKEGADRVRPGSPPPGVWPADLVADSNWRAWQFIHREAYRQAKIIHLVRNPLHYIRSYSEPFWLKMDHQSPTEHARYREEMRRHAVNWVTINTRVAFYAHDTIRIESCPGALLEAVNMPDVTPGFDDRRYNAHWKGKVDVIWDDVRWALGDRFDLLADMARKYGYTVQ